MIIQTISLFSFFFFFCSAIDTFPSKALLSSVKFRTHYLIIFSCDKALRPLSLMSSKFLVLTISFLEIISSFLSQHLLYRFSIVISIYPCSVVFFIFLEVLSSLSAINLLFCSSIFSRYYCLVAILLFKVIFSVLYSFAYIEIFF